MNKKDELLSLKLEILLLQIKMKKTDATSSKSYLEHKIEILRERVEEIRDSVIK